MDRAISTVETPPTLHQNQAVIATSRNTNDWWDIDRTITIQPLTPQQTLFVFVNVCQANISQTIHEYGQFGSVDSV